MTTLAHNLQNDNRYDVLVAKVKELAQDEGAGERAKPRLAVTIASGAADRVISTERDKKTKRDDIDEMYDLYVKTKSKKNPEDHSAGGRAAKTSELRTIAVAASKPTADFVHAIRDRLPEMLKELNKANIDCISEYAAMVKAARTQKAQDEDLTDEQLSEALVKPAPKDKELLKELEQIKKRIDRVISGEAGVQSDDPDVKAAGVSIGNAILALMLLQEQAELAVLAAKHGMTVTPQGNVEPNVPQTA